MSKREVWVADATEGYVLGHIVEEKGEEQLLVELSTTGTRLQLHKDAVQRANPAKLDKSDDMAQLSYLNEASVLHNLRQRFYADLIYSWSGLFCVAVNPYKPLAIYASDIAELYKGARRSDRPPHIFAVADAAYRAMLVHREDQSILCTGESGAGKTMTTGFVVDYLSRVAGARQPLVTLDASRSLDMDMSSSTMSRLGGHLEAQLCAAGPVLEAFGNAQTAKNDNSSRFGKFIKINFDASGCVAGASIEFYLLEKSRVIRQAPSERNYHIFYQLLRGASGKMREELLLEKSVKSETFRLLSNGTTMKIPNVDDAAAYKETVQTLEVMGFAQPETDALMRVVSAILHGGNIEFMSERNGEQAQFVSDVPLQRLCHLLGLSVPDTTRAILTPRINVGREFVTRAQTPAQAAFAVEAVAKGIYERLFRWLVTRLNRSLGKARRPTSAFIGILDIAGFEVFELNTFEQLCINYCNEKLQQLYNRRMFEKEQEEYVAEGIEWTYLDFGLDLQPTIDLIEKPMGIMALLDEESVFPRATDATFTQKLIAAQATHSKFIVPELRAKADFAVVHYAGRVDYSSVGWLDKNRDPQSDALVAVMQASTDSFVAELWKDAQFNSLNTSPVAGSGGSGNGGDRAVVAALADQFGAARPRKGMLRTVSYIYKEQLARLMTTLQGTAPHFVRCIIPNPDKKPGKIDAPLVLEQLRCNGVLEGIRICRQGYPSRLPFQEFRKRYERVLCPDACPKGFMDGREAVRRMIEALELEERMFRIGKSKIFLRQGVLANLEERRDEKLSDLILSFQSYCRRALARRNYQRRVQQEVALRVIQRNALAFLRLRSWPWWSLFTRVRPLLKMACIEEQVVLLQESVRTATERAEKHEQELKQTSERCEKLTDERRKQQLELEELTEQLYTEQAAKAQLVEKNVRQQAEIDELVEQIESERRGKSDEKTQLRQQLAEMRKKLDEVTGEAAQKARVEAAREMDKLKQELEDAKLALERSERAKRKAQQEAEDAQRELAQTSTAQQAAERRARRTDVAVAEERKIAQQNADERDALAAQLRETESRLLLANKEATAQRERIDELERARRHLQLEVDTLASDQENRNSLELEQQRRKLADELQRHQQMLVDLEDAMQQSEDARTRLQVQLQAVRQEHERALQQRELDEEERSRLLEKKVRDLEDDLEAERRARRTAMEARKRADQQTKVQSEALTNVGRQLDDAQRGLRKVAASLKEAERMVSTANETGDGAANAAGLTIPSGASSTVSQDVLLLQ